MAVLPKFRPGFRRTTTDDVAGSVAMSPMTENEKHPATSSAEGPPTSNGDTEAPAAELPTEDAQRGVQNVEAITLTWSKKALVAIFIKYESTLRQRWHTPSCH